MNKKTSLKKVYLISSNLNAILTNKIKEGLEEKKVKYQHLDSDFLLFDATGKDLKVVYQNKVLNFDSSYTFFSNRNRNIYLNSLLVMVLDFMKIKHSAKIYKYIKQTEDKHHQVINLFLNKISVPKTIICSHKGLLENKDYIEKKFKDEFVLKTSGSRGDFVWKVKNLKEAMLKLEDVDEEKKKLLTLQGIVPKADYDIRALFFKNKCISAMKRQGEGFLNNHSQGASVEKYTLSKKELEVCKKASKISGLDFLGIDYMNTKNGPVILELQNSPYMRGMRSTDKNLNIGKSIAEEILKIKP